MDIGGLLSKVKSGAIDLNGDGHTDMKDLMAVFNGGGGGVMDKLKGMFGS